MRWGQVSQPLVTDRFFPPGNRPPTVTLLFARDGAVT